MKRIVLAVILLLVASQVPASALYDFEIEHSKSSQAIIGLAEAHAMGFTGKGQTIVILDTGVQIDHPYLKDALISGYCSSVSVCGTNYDNPSITSGAAVKIPGTDFPIDSHGSLTSGIAVGRGAGNIPGGVAPGANLISINNTNGQGIGIVKALDWVLSVKEKYNIVAINASFAAPDLDLRNQPGKCVREKEIAESVKRITAAGIAFVAATGNDGNVNNLAFPACLPDVISVGAVDYAGEITGYSNIAQSISLLAPADLIGANTTSGYWVGAGTSSAAPVVTGAIAILKQVKPSATLSEIKQALLTTANYRNDFMWKNIPVLNLPAAIKAMQSGIFSKVEVSSTLEVADTTKFDLASALAREKTLAEEISKLSAKVKELENSNLKSETSLSEAKVTSFTLNLDLASALAREKTLVEEISKLSAKVKELENSNLKSESSLSEAKATILSLQNEAVASLDLISDLQNKMKSANDLIAKLEAASKLTTITCVKGKLSKKVTAINPKCPTGYKKRV